MRYLALILLLLLVVLASGCMDSSSDSAGIAVERLDMEPDSITEGNSFSIILDVRNSGLLEGKVDVGDSEGKEVLTNYCPDYFDISSFNARTDRGSDESSEHVYSLEDGEKMQMNWELDQKGAEIPSFGYDCNLRFEVPFNYSVRGFKQLQVLEDRNVETNTELSEDVSTGPMAFDMELIGTSSTKKNTFINGENVSIYLTAYNQREEDEGEFTGLIEMQDLQIETNGAVSLADRSCLEKDNVVLSAGEQDIYRCPLEVNEEYQNPSSRGEIVTYVNYTYVRDLPSRTVEVTPRGR